MISHARTRIIYVEHWASHISKARYRSLFAGAHLPAIAVECLTANAVWGVVLDLGLLAISREPGAAQQGILNKKGKTRMSAEVTDEDLREFLEWFDRWHGHKAVDVSVMTTCMTGHFKTYPKAADKLLARCKRLKLVAVSDGVVTISTP